MKGYYKTMVEAEDTPAVGGTSKEKKAARHVKDIGFTPVDGHPEDHKFIADVIFVHGLQGHPKRTWQSKSITEIHKSRRRRRWPFSPSISKKENHEDNGLFWPANLLPRDFKNVRILTYGYDSKVTKFFKGSTSKNGIFQHGRSLLEALSMIRVDCSDRPSIIVAHSLGYVYLIIFSSSRSIITHVKETRISLYYQKIRIILLRYYIFSSVSGPCLKIR